MWELRLGDFRVFYQVERRPDDAQEDDADKVLAIAIGHKEHNELFIRGGKVEP